MNSFQLVIPLERAALWAEETLHWALPGVHPWLDIAFGPPDVSKVDPIDRRRLSRLARGMFHCASRVAPEGGDMRTVFASRHGDLARTLALMEELAESRTVSPSLFSLSVHNSTAGLWSLCQKNRAPSTAIAAGPETFGLGLLEAWAAWKREPDRPVLYVFGEDSVPRPYQASCPEDRLLHAAAFLIGEPCDQHLHLSGKPGCAKDHPLPLSLELLRPICGRREIGTSLISPQGWEINVV